MFGNVSELLAGGTSCIGFVDEADHSSLEPASSDKWDESRHFLKISWKLSIRQYQGYTQKKKKKSAHACIATNFPTAFSILSWLLYVYLLSASIYYLVKFFGGKKI